MRVALISDLHGNLLALEAVLADLERERPDRVLDRVLCLGDVAATGPRPRETVGCLRGIGCPVVMGNADDELLRPIPDAGDEGGRKIVEIDRWCAGRLAPEDLDYLRGFRPTLEFSLGSGRTLLCFHGSPRSFDDTIVATTPEEELAGMLSGHEAAVMAGGHTHEQFVRQHAGTTLINPGSVGLNPPVAEYALVDLEDGRLAVELRRLPLDAARIRREALDSGMPHAEWWAGFWEEN